MFALAFDLNTEETDRHHPKSTRQAYLDIEITMRRFGFERIQWSVYASAEEDLANLFRAVDALRGMEWFGPSIRSLRAFRMQQGADLTVVVRGE